MKDKGRRMKKRLPNYSYSFFHLNSFNKGVFYEKGACGG